MLDRQIIRPAGSPGTVRLITSNALNNQVKSDATSTVFPLVGAASINYAVGSSNTIYAYSHFQQSNTDTALANSQGLEAQLMQLEIVVYARHNSGFGSGQAVSMTGRIYLMEAEWDPTTLNYDNRPAFGSFYIDVAISASDGEAESNQNNFPVPILNGGQYYGIGLEITSAPNRANVQYTLTATLERVLVTQ